MTEAKTINEGYYKIKSKMGNRFAKEYFKQVDRLLNPNENTIIEYRVGGVVTSDGMFHALADMELKKWRIAFSINQKTS